MRARGGRSARSEREGFAAALGRGRALSCADLVGLEHEYALERDGRPVDFRDLIHGLAVGGRRLDPGDTNAYRTRSGMAITCDEAEAEIATPPIPLRPGFAQALIDWGAEGRRAIAGLLPSDVVAGGYSTHISVSVADQLNDPACQLFARTFAPAFALILERPESQGVYVRPRPGRMELCGEYAEGETLAAAATLAAGGARACAEAILGHSPLLPPEVEVVTLPGVERFGLRVRRDAYGLDLYREGRAAALHRVGGGFIRAGDQLALAAEAAERALIGVASPADLAPLRRLVRGTEKLAVEGGSARSAAAGRPVAATPFGQILERTVRPRFSVETISATWDATVFRIDGRARVGFAVVPRDLLARFLERLRNGHLDRAVERYLATPPAGRVLVSRGELGSAELYDHPPPPELMIAEERMPVGQLNDAEPEASPRASKRAPATGRMGKLAGPVDAAADQPGEGFARRGKSARRWKALLLPRSVPRPFAAPPALRPTESAPAEPAPARPARLAVRWLLVGGAALVLLAAAAAVVVRGQGDASGGATPSPASTVIPAATPTLPLATAAAASPTNTARPATARPTDTAAAVATTTTTAASTVTPGAANTVATATPAAAPATATALPSTPTVAPTDTPPSPTPTRRPADTPAPTLTSTPTPRPVATPTPVVVIVIPPTAAKPPCTPSPGATC